MWGGRFAGGPAAVMREINASIAVDKRLWREDIAASKAHAAMLGKQGILSADEAAAIADGLDRIAGEYAAGKLVEDPALEDIHMHVEQRLSELVGPVAGKLHTARSRNDQVATDFKLFVRSCIDEAVAGIDERLAAEPQMWRRIALRHSMGEFLAKTLCSDHGDNAEQLAAALNERAPMTVRANLLRATRDDVAAALAEEGITTRPGKYSDTALIVDSRGIDTTAAWPKYQHDPRNTGNADTPVSEFACD